MIATYRCDRDLDPLNGAKCESMSDCVAVPRNLVRPLTTTEYERPNEAFIASDEPR
jgi:hypothetical protein